MNLWGGALYYLLFKDDYSGFRCIFVSRKNHTLFNVFNKFMVTSFEIQEIISKFSEQMAVQNLLASVFRNVLLRRGFAMRSLPLTLLNKMVSATRDNRTIMESVRSLFHTSGLPLSFWGEACHTTLYTLNRTGSRLIPCQTPFTFWYGFKLSLEQFRVFECHAYAYIEKKHRIKFDPKSHLCYFLGYCDNTKGYRLWDPTTSQVLIRREVIFHEQLLYGHVQELFSFSETIPIATFSLQSSPIADRPLSFSSPSSISSSCAPLSTL